MSLFRTALIASSFQNTPADEVYWFYKQVNSVGFNISGSAVLKQPMKYLDNLAKIQSVATNIMTAIQDIHPTKQMTVDLGKLQGYLSGIADKVQSRIEAIAIASEKPSKEIAASVCELKKFATTFRDISARIQKSDKKISESKTSIK